uniref:AAA+ ATPase domain-containing protein n=1 Tax=Zooxanthella nutricula TaxID=1333877 RepID=A0A7S2NWR4_9DINO
MAAEPCARAPAPARAELLRSSAPFSAEDAPRDLPFDVRDATYLEVTCGEEPLYSYVLRHVSRIVKDARSIRADMGRDSLSRGMYSPDDDDDIFDIKGFGKGKGFSSSSSSKRKRPEVKMPSAGLGLGWHPFELSDGKDAKVPAVLLVQRLGKPAGNGPSMYGSLVAFVAGQDQQPLLRLCKEATEAATKVKENRVSLWRYDTKMNFWAHNARRLARSLDSIVLEEGIKKPLLDDIEWFIKDETRAFYAKHGIPYHRCYLFHGDPGTGKTSFMYALAGYLQRNLCFVQMDKGMTDDTFRNAMSRLPSTAMVVLEDIDALFTNHREVDHSTSSLSFSGFLNCLDGLGAPDDVIVCMTTNHPEKLDPAVTRPGRIDMKVAFKSPSADVAARYFLTFFPGESSAAAAFGRSVGGRISERRVSMAQLQHFFLYCHRQEVSAARAAELVADFSFEDGFSSTKWAASYS